MECLGEKSKLFLGKQKKKLHISNQNTLSIDHNTLSGMPSVSKKIFSRLIHLFYPILAFKNSHNVSRQGVVKAFVKYPIITESFATDYAISV